MRNTSHIKSGISYLEILVTLIIIGMITTFVVPSFLQRKQSTIQVFLEQLEELIAQTANHAIISNSVHQIYFDLTEKTVRSMMHNAKKQFVPVPEDEISNNMVRIPTSVSMKHFFIEQKDEFKAGHTTKTLWFYSMPDGTSQPITMYFEDDEVDGPHTAYSIVINPFFSQITRYDGLKKP